MPTKPSTDPETAVREKNNWWRDPRPTKPSTDPETASQEKSGYRKFRRHEVAARWASNIGLSLLLFGLIASSAGADQIVSLCFFATGASILAAGRVMDAERFGGYISMMPLQLSLLLLYFGFATGCFAEIADLIREDGSTTVPTD